MGSKEQMIWIKDYRTGSSLIGADHIKTQLQEAHLAGGWEEKEHSAL